MEILFSLEAALKKAGESAELKKIVEGNKGYLSAVYSTFRNVLEEWHFSYYCPEKKQAAVFKVGKETVDFEGFSGLMSGRVGGRLEAEKAEVGAQQALDIAKEKVFAPYEEVLITLQNPEGTQVWIVNFFTKELDLISITVDASAGKVLKEHKTTLVVGSAK